MENFKNQGIYAIENTINHGIYIGSSTNFGSRKDKHFSLLRHNKHTNHLLQNDVIKYGIDNFSFKVIEFTIENLKEKEQYYINLYNPLYNITTDVIKNTPSESSRLKMSKTRLRMYQEGLEPNCRRKVVGINTETGEVTEYHSIRQAYTLNNIDRSALQRTLRGIYNQMKGFKWYYKDKYLDLIKSCELLENPEEDNQQPSIVEIQ